MESWKIEKDLCRCCHSEGSFRALSDLCIIGGEEGFYNDMLRLTLNIQLKPVNGLLETYTYTICDSCVLRLRDATSFKQQVLLCEERFQDMYNKGVIKLEEPVIKQELPESEDDKMDDADLDDGHDTFEPDDVMDSSDAAVKIDLEICKADPEPIDAKRRSTRKKAAVKSQEKTKSKTKTRKTKGKPETSGEGEDAAKKDTDDSEARNNFTTLVQDENQSFSCNECGMIFNSIYSIHNHINKKHLIRYNFPCYICKETFKAQDPRHKHLLKAHGMEEVMIAGKYTTKPAQKVACDVCKKEYPAKFRLLIHMRYHKTFKCPECSVELTKRDLTRHRAEKHGVDMPTCGVCGFKHISKARVITHQRKVHLKEKHVSCPQCEDMFFDVQQLKRHLVRHNPVKIYECTFCKKKFPRLNTLREHEKIHTGDKRKVCPVCDERFVQKASLNYHMTKHHPEAC